MDDSLIRAAADLLCNYQYTPWFYGDSIGLDGLLEASELLDDRYYEGFVAGFGRGVIGRDPDVRTYDNTVAGRALTRVAVRRSDTVLLVGLSTLAGHLRQRRQVRGVPISLPTAALRAPYGGETLSGREIALLTDPGPAIYVDCMHFDPPFLTALGRALDDDDLVDEGTRLALAYCDLLQQDRGLFHHFYLESTDTTFVPAWSRGQGWALLGLVETLEGVGRDHPDAAALAERLVRLADGMLALQRPDGHWSAVADDPDCPVETSTAAFFGAGLLKAIRIGILGSQYRRAAMAAADATLAKVDAAGQLRDVSAVVWSATRPSHYAHVSVDHLVPWGQGPLLLLAGELRRVVTATDQRTPEVDRDPQ